MSIYLLRSKAAAAALLVFTFIATGCTNRANDKLSIEHSPVVATSTEQVTFTAKAVTSSSDYRIRIFVNDSLVHTCYNTPECSYTDGPYPSYEGSSVSFLARLDTFDCDIRCDKWDGYYEFGVTDANYNWGTNKYIPARVSVGNITAPSGTDEILLIHMADDYATNGKTFADFVGHVHEKIYDVYADQDIIKKHMDDMDIYVYTREATLGNCGTVHWQTNVEVPWRDDDAILHYTPANDCTDGSLSRFTAEGLPSVDFLHHSGHAIFGLADEGCTGTGYFESLIEPNIFSSQEACRAEQNLKLRNPDACYEFCGNGWWGIHTGTTVMSNGAVGDPWGVEAEERINYFFNNL